MHRPTAEATRTTNFEVLTVTKYTDSECTETHTNSIVGVPANVCVEKPFSHDWEFLSGSVSIAHYYLRTSSILSQYYLITSS